MPVNELTLEEVSGNLNLTKVEGLTRFFWNIVKDLPLGFVETGHNGSQIRMETKIWIISIDVVCPEDSIFKELVIQTTKGKRVYKSDPCGGVYGATLTVFEDGFEFKFPDHNGHEVTHKYQVHD